MQGKFVLFLFCLTGSHCRPGWPGISSVREDGLELKILTPPALRCWDYSVCHHTQQNSLFNNEKYKQALKD